MRIISIGEIIWDVYKDEEYIGGAPFNFSVHLNILGHEVYFISAVGSDLRGDLGLQCISNCGLKTKYITRVKHCPTGYVDVTIGVDGFPSYIIHRPAAFDFPSLTSEQINNIISFKPDWLYFGTVQQISTVARELTRNLIELLPKTRCFYDMNLRSGHYTKDLVKELLKSSSILKLNGEEVRIFCELFNKKPMELKDFCRWSVNSFELEGVCITMGQDGCVVFLDGEYIESAGYQVKVVNPVGAGDAFAAGFLHGISKNWKLNKTCDFANRLGASTIKNKGAIPDWEIDEGLSN